jgi:hypothetical protein
MSLCAVNRAGQKGGWAMYADKWELLKAFIKGCAGTATDETSRCLHNVIRQMEVYEEIEKAALSGKDKLSN